MDRKELRTRWLMGTIQPELFYIPWKKRKNNKHYVFIWANFWGLSKTYPTIQDYKQQRPNGFEYEFGFIIYNDKGGKVSDFSFGISLPSGKYYAIQYYSTSSRKISYPHGKIPFEIKDTDGDIYLYVDVSSRKYILNVKFKSEQCEQLKARYRVIQNYDGKERTASVTELELASLEDGSNVITAAGLSHATDTEESWTEEYTVAKAEEKTLLTYSNYTNNVHSNSLSQYPKIQLSKEIETNVSQRYKVYFDIIEINNWYACIDYTFNYFEMYGYQSYGNSSGSVSTIYGRQYLSADKSWFTQNGFFVDETGGLSIFTDIHNNTHMLISNDNTNGYIYTEDLLPNTRMHFAIGYPIYQYYDLDEGQAIDERYAGRNRTLYNINSANYAKFNYLNNIPSETISYKGDGWGVRYLSEFVSYPLNTERTSFAFFGNLQYDNKDTLTNDEILDIYNSENSITPENGNDFVNNKGFLWLVNAISDLIHDNNAGMPYRPFISSEEMSASGYNINLGSYVSLYNDWTILPEWYFESYEIKKIRYVIVHYTPIRRDGKVLTKEQIQQYMNIICNNNKDNVQNDTNRYSTLQYEDYRSGYNDTNQYGYMYQLIIETVKNDITNDITSEEYENYCNGIFSDNIKNIINIENQRREQFTNLQNKFNEMYLEAYPNTDLSTAQRWQYYPYFDLF